MLSGCSSSPQTIKEKPEVKRGTIVIPPYQRHHDLVSYPAKTEGLYKVHVFSTAPANSTAPAVSTTPANVEPNDLREFKQDISFYLKSPGVEGEYITVQRQKQIDKKYNEEYFSVWHRDRATVAKSKVLDVFEKFSKKPGFGENMRPHGEDWILKLKDNANLGTYPNTGAKAITVVNADLRELPTQRPAFDGVEHSWDAYPFDNLQVSALPANTPIFISQTSKDRSWVLAETPFGVGWIAIQDIAYVDKNFIRKWEIGQYVVLTRDELPIIDQEGSFRFYGYIGFLFPKAGESKDNFGIRLAVADERRIAMIKLATIRKTQAAGKPLRFTLSAMARLGMEMMNQPYGWGGMYQNRDCSSMIKDLFTPFGFWLPRNSTDQAARGGQYIDLRELDPAERENRILKDGVPFLTLIKVKDPNHIMLYLGNHKGRAAVFHNFWGIRTKSSEGAEGRVIIGRAVITSLTPGIERPDIDPKGTLLYRTQGMTILARQTTTATTTPTTTTTAK